MSSIVLLSACATKVVGLKQSPTFTGQSLTTEGIAILGVTSLKSTLSESEKNELANELKAQLIEKQPGIRTILPYGNVRMSIGEKKHELIMKDFTAMGVIKDEHKVLIQKAQLPVRYYALVIIESDDIEKSRSDYRDKDSYGIVQVESTKVIASIKRNVVANYQIFDAKTGEQAWGGIIEKTKNEHREYTKDKDPGLVQLVKAIKGKSDEQDPDKLYPYPEAPSLRNVMSVSFAGFAQSLPKIE